MTGGRPALILVVDLEGCVQAYVDAFHEEDAERLALWLARSDDRQVQAAADLAHDVWEKAT